MAKEFFFEKEAQDNIREGVNKAAKAAGFTLGARGKLVAISPGYNLPPIITKDGVTVIRHSIIEDEKTNVGGLMIRYAAEKTLSECGDGTTTSAVLAQCMINEGLDIIASGGNAQQIKSGVEKAVKAIVNRISSIAVKDISNEMIKNVATISANNDSEIGELIAEAYDKIGKDGILTIQKSKDQKTHVDVVNGPEMLSGWAHEKFINNRKEMSVEYDDPLVFVANFEIKTMAQIAPFLESVNIVHPLNKRPLIIVAKGFEGEFFNTAVVNKVEHGALVCLIQAPFEYQDDFLVDFAAATGSNLISESAGKKVENATVNDCGRCSKIIIKKTSTTIVNGNYSEHKMKDLKGQIIHEINTTEDEKHKEYLQNRLGRLSGNIGVIYVGGITDVEQKERYDRVDDAVRAVKSAIEEGIVAGGGIALINAVSALDDIVVHGDEEFGVNMVHHACYSPLKTMIKNAELDFHEISANIHEKKEIGYGFNIKDEVYGDMIEMNIIDPAKVVRCALQNAASVACQVINTEVLLIELLKKD